MNKKALQLSVTFIVWLILALVVFGMGMTLFRQFFTEAENIKQNLDEETRKELQQIMMASSEEVIIYPTHLTVLRGKSGVFGVGILNIKTTENFEIKPEFNQLCYNREGGTMPCDADDIQVIDTIQRKIKGNSRETIEIPFRVNNKVSSGKYAIQVNVTRVGELSPISTNLIYITVP